MGQDGKLNRETLTGDNFFNRVKWDQEAPYYNRMNSMEAEGTEKELDCLPITAEDTVLDIGCGPGRMTIPLARRTAHVYAIDFSQAMVDICRENCGNAHVTNVTCLQSDWKEEQIGRAYPEVDIAVQSRWSGGASTLEQFRAAARKYAVIIEWYKNAPRIARNLLFQGCYSENSMEQYPDLRPFDQTLYRDNSTQSLGQKSERDMRLKQQLKDAGIPVETRILEEGWHLERKDKEEIIDYLIQLSMHPELVDRTVFCGNVGKYLTKREDGWSFYMPTWSKVEYFATR